MRLAIFYHNLASKSPSCPTLVQVKELDFAYYLRRTRTCYCAARKQYTLTGYSTNLDASPERNDLPLFHTSYSSPTGKPKGEKA
jgi:hypothetical protein